MEDRIEQATAAPGEKRDVPICGEEMEWRRFTARCCLRPGHDGPHSASMTHFKGGATVAPRRVEE